MIKRLLIMSLVVVGLGVAIVYWLEESATTTLAETVSGNKDKDAFILHIRIENSNEGFRVLQSLEYVGDEQITIEHRTPLISISVGAKQSDFTGSTTSKTLEPGDIYRPNNSPEIYEPLEVGTHEIYVHCQFFVGEETIDIEMVKEVVFK